MTFNSLGSKLRVNSSRVYLDAFIAEAAATLATDGWILDAGAGDCRYQHHFAHAQYESADFAKVDKAYGDLTYVCDLTHIPVDDARYDLVLLTQVLEHLPEPQRVLTELNRVLKPGGQLWLSAPLFFEEHEQPYDFYRYTQYGLRQLLTASGFTVQRLQWLEGYLGTVSYQMALAARTLPWRAVDLGGGITGGLAGLFLLGIRPFLALLSVLLGRLDARHKFVDGGLCKNYAVVAVKTESGQ